MKICLVNNLLDPWSRGGAEKIVNNLAKTMADDNQEVFFISTKPVSATTPQTENKTHYYLPSYYHNLNKWPYVFKLFWHLFSFFNYRRQYKLKKILVKEAPDLIITNNLMGIGFGLGRLAQNLKIKHLHIIHDVQLLHPSGLVVYGQVGELSSPLAKFYQYLTKYSLGHPQAVITASSWLMEKHLAKNFFITCRRQILTNPLNEKCFTNNQKGDNYLFLFVGQIEEHKGIKILLSAWEDFLDRTKATGHLVVVGDGSILESLKKIKIPQVDFRGRLTGQDLVNVYAQATCLVVPSLCYENSPTVIYEAALVGLPVIASSLGGTKELLAPDYLFKPEIKILSDKLLWAYKKRGELKAPQFKILSGKEYWLEIKKYAQ